MLAFRAKKLYICTMEFGSFFLLIKLLSEHHFHTFCLRFLCKNPNKIDIFFILRSKLIE